MKRLRPLSLPASAKVEIDEEGCPITVKVEGRLRKVVGVRERWRIDDEWWREPISRLYFSLVMEDGSSRIVYRDLVRGGWFAQPPGE